MIIRRVLSPDLFSRSAVTSFSNFNFITVSLGKMRRNMHSTNDCVRFNREKLVSNEYSMKMVVDMLREIKQDMSQFTYHVKMDSVDVSEFFPLRSATCLEKFFDRVFYTYI